MVIYTGMNCVIYKNKDFFFDRRCFLGKIIKIYVLISIIVSVVLIVVQIFS